ncbi:MAG: radical SAM protein [Rikenellaceae bacterium]
MTQKPKTSRIIALMLTYSCNLNCVYCFEKHKSNDPSKRMTFEIAKEIIEKEFSAFQESGDKGSLKVDFFGGEPLLNFGLIQRLAEWIWQQDFKINYVLSVTTNGSLLNDDMKKWFTEHKEHFRLILSVDGNEHMQMNNRGCSQEDLPIDFVRQTWPDLYLKMTMGRDSLPTFADGLIHLCEKGYNVSGSIAIGEKWTHEDAMIYKEQLEKIAEYYLCHPDVTPTHLFNRVWGEMLDPVYDLELPPKNCGTGTTMAAYDVDGYPYPCHLFLPIVHGKEIREDLKKIDFFDKARMIDEDCRKCGLLKICRTCYGYNYIERGDVNKRDKCLCEMLLVEAVVISAFQVKYLMQRKDTLDSEQLLALKAAIKCYETYKDFEF